MDLSKILTAANALNTIVTNPGFVAELKSLHELCDGAKSEVDKLAAGAAPGTINPTMLAVARGNAAAAITAAQSAGAALANVVKFVQGHIAAHPSSTPTGATSGEPAAP